MISLHHSLRHDPDHAAVPSRACQHYRELLLKTGTLVHLYDDRAQDFLFHPLPLAVQPFQPFGNFPRARRLGRSEQVDHIARVFHASGGIKTWREPEAHVAGADFLSCES